MAKENNKEPIISTEDMVEEKVEVQPPRSRAWLSAKYPDKTYETDEDWDNALTDELESNASALEAYKASDEVLSELLDMNPELAMIVEDMKSPAYGGKGMPFMVALARNVDLDDLKPIEGEEDFEAYTTEYDTRKASNAARKQREAELQANMEASATEIEEYVESLSWSDEKKEEFDNWFNALINDMAENRLTRQSMQIFVDAFTHDEDVKRAEREGKIQGRNEQIETKRNRAEDTDGMPDNAGGRVESKPEAPQRAVFDWDRLKNK